MNPNKKIGLGILGIVLSIAVFGLSIALLEKFNVSPENSPQFLIGMLLGVPFSVSIILIIDGNIDLGNNHQINKGE